MELELIVKKCFNLPFLMGIRNAIKKTTWILFTLFIYDQLRPVLNLDSIMTSSGPWQRLAFLQSASVERTFIPEQRHSFRLLAVEVPAEAETHHGYAVPQVLPSDS